jgi:endonuclease/exonuclease/phosphatase (EEP) superfamily protein YafD
MTDILKERSLTARHIFVLLLAAALAAACGGCAKPFTYLPSRNYLRTVDNGAAPTVRNDSLRVVSYNIYLSNDIDQAIVDLQGNERLAGADILLLQEMDAADTERIALALGMNSVYWPSFKWLRNKTFGNAILSPWPITEQLVVALPHANPLIGFKRLGVAADIRVGRRTVRAVNVHLSTVITPLNRRLEQATTMLDSLADVSGPVVFAGDFNTVTRSDRLAMNRLMRKAGLRQVLLPPGPTASSLLDFTGLTLILDHFYYRGLVAGEGGIDRTAAASDHYPIWATFAWPDADGESGEIR